MKQLLEFFPLVIFFGVYQLSGTTLTLGGYAHTVDGIYSATLALIIATPVSYTHLTLPTTPYV